MTRSAPAYTTQRCARVKPTRTSPASSASESASDVGAPTATTAEMPGDHGLLDELESDAAAEHEHRRHGVATEDPRADHLVDGVVPTHVLAYDDPRPVRREQAGRVQPARPAETGLLLGQPVGQGEDRREVERHRLSRCRGLEHVLDRVGAADPARRVHEPGRRHRQRGSGEVDRDDVELLERGERLVGAVAHGVDGVGRGHSLVHQPAGGELEVVTRCAHRDGHPLGGGVGSGDTDLERLLGRHAVLVVEPGAVTELGDTGPNRWSGSSRLRRTHTPDCRTLAGIGPSNVCPCRNRSSLGCVP